MNSRKTKKKQAFSLFLAIVLAIMLCSCAHDTGISEEAYETMYAHLVQMWAQSVEAGDGTCGIAFYGDSRVAGANWEEAYPDCDVVNLGIGGDRVEQTLTRLSLLDAFQVKYCFLAIGGNNALSSSFNADTFRTNYDKLLTELENRGITVYVNTVAELTKTVATKSKENKTKNGNIKTVNGIIKELATSHGMEVVDMAVLMADDEGYLKEEYANTDGVHFSEAGNQFWYQSLKTLVEEADAKLKAD